MIYMYHSPNHIAHDYAMAMAAALITFDVLLFEYFLFQLAPLNLCAI